MKTSIKISYVFICLCSSYFSQVSSLQTPDSIEDTKIEEVIVIGKTNPNNKQTKALSTIDSYLESNSSINMVRRGAYAWEALINGMATERSVVTIDGMRIFGACTDKMDPITSYVETTNLSKVSVHSGQSGAAHGTTIAGSINLEKSHSDFDNKGFTGTVFSGIETNNLQKILGGKMQYAGKVFYIDLDYSFRDAENYKAGGRTEVLYSQFRKQNASTNLGFKLNAKNSISTSFIYDRATNVGYPALPMDVALAEAYIASVQHTYSNTSKKLGYWETKLYFNQVTHIMDDSKRPNVPIRMDMPGWTKTTGFYSKGHIHAGKHHINIMTNGYFNYALAEMTMFPNNPNEKPMFMITWPKVNTYCFNVHIDDKTWWNKHWFTQISAGAGINFAQLKDSLGLQSLQIFYPQLVPEKLRILSNGGLKAGFEKNRKSIQFGIAYSERAPSISEAYGYYLFNSYDRYDYIGNPTMKNEKSMETSMETSIGFSKFILKGNVSYFHLMDYIIGKENNSFYGMTIGGNGVKVYEQLHVANIFNSSISVQVFPVNGFVISAKGVYRSGTSGNLNLPFIQPFSYGGTLKYTIRGYSIETTVEGATKQHKFSPSFGESQAKAYTLLHAGFAKSFEFPKAQQLLVKCGVENILDRHYSTFADWNKIPRMGRNIYVNIIYSFQVSKKVK